MGKGGGKSGGGGGAKGGKGGAKGGAKGGDDSGRSQVVIVLSFFKVSSYLKFQWLIFNEADYYSSFVFDLLNV